MQETAQNQESVFDAEAEQRIPVGDGVYAVIAPYTDKRFDKYREDFTQKVNELMARRSENSIEQAEIKQAIEQDCALGKELLITLENYGELPEDWKDKIEAEDLLALIRQATTFVIDENGKKFSLGATVNVPTACTFNGSVARQNHQLRRKTIDDSSRYALLKSKEYMVKPAEKFGEEKTVEYKLQDDSKAALYDEMREKVTGFKKDIVPKRVKIQVIDYLFASSINGKK